MEGSKTRSLHASSVCVSIISAAFLLVCAYWPLDIEQLKAASTKACTYQTWHMLINWATSILAYMHRPSDVGQLQATSTKVFKHLSWFVHIYQETSDNNMHYHQRHACITCGVCIN